MVMETSWDMENWSKVMEFCDLVMEVYQFCPQFVLNVTNSELWRALVMENLEMVMGKSWEIFCQVCGNTTHAHMNPSLLRCG